jgi:sortase family protein
VFAFVATLIVTLAFTWSDGAPAEDDPLDVGPVASSVVVAIQDPANDVYLDPSFPVPPISEPKPPPQAPIPRSRPVQLLIPKLDVHRAVEAVGVTRLGVMQLPSNSWNAGWYKGSPTPGAPGDTVIEGHAGYPDQPMIFGRLVNLRPGGKIIVVLADKTRQLSWSSRCEGFRSEQLRPGWLSPTDYRGSPSSPAPALSIRTALVFAAAGARCALRRPGLSRTRNALSRS